ncbi:uncharacterized protein LOC107025071 [Solanum pennellii]|uniref:Uncharacterized protein LOC107025071 n=1 Tax=Solanum pennellii TaxID=28526 RepID=A0ABM1H7C5_SOLPN|nr:uncharacterized protein LOC107025071 [Solanum pennellii]
MQDCKPVSTPISTGVKLGKDGDSEKVDDSMYRRLIGSFLYLTASRPDILFVVSLLSSFMHRLETHTSQLLKELIRYIKGTRLLGIFFPTSAEVTMNLIGYSDSDWGGGVDDLEAHLDIFSIWGQVVLVGALENKKLQLNTQ